MTGVGTGETRGVYSGSNYCLTEIKQQQEFFLIMDRSKDVQGHKRMAGWSVGDLLQQAPDRIYWGNELHYVLSSVSKDT